MIVTWLLLIPHCYYGTRLVESRRRWGNLLIGLGFALFWGSLILYELSMFEWSWGWWL